MVWLTEVVAISLGLEDYGAIAVAYECDFSHRSKSAELKKSSSASPKDCRFSREGSQLAILFLTIGSLHENHEECGPKHNILKPCPCTLRHDRKK
jgi:hypothetical protein